jgi:hypothetical protein
MPRAIAKIVSLMDLSNSMNFYNYITPAKADLDTFINMFQPGDKFSIISFRDTISYVYPTSASLTTANPVSLADASSKVRAMTASGNTNIGDAIIAGTNVLNPESEPRGMVLLSDGEWNKGPNPLNVLPSNIRIYTIALGDHGQLDTLRKIATQTQGQYLFTPDAIGLASIYFDILEYAKVGRVVTNAFRSIQNAQMFPALVKLSAGLDSASVAVNWADPTITFTSGTPGTNQVKVRILDPDFKPVQLEPVYRDYGFVVYTLPTPKAGNWSFDTFYYGNKTCNVTAGAIDPDQLSVLTLDAPREAVPAGETFTVRARLSHDGRPLERAALAAAADVPAVSLDEALAAHRHDLNAVKLPEDVDPKGPGADRSRLQALRQQRLPYVDLLPRHTLPASVRATADGDHEITVHTHKPGEYVVRVEATGPHPNGGEVMRTRLVTVSVR